MNKLANASSQKTTMVRATEKTKAILKNISEAEGRPQVDLLEEAVIAWERQRLLREMKRGYQALYSSPREGAEYEAETALYENAVGDGLDRS